MVGLDGEEEAPRRMKQEPCMNNLQVIIIMIVLVMMMMIIMIMIMIMEEEEDTSKSMSIRLQPQEWFLENKITWVTMLAVLAAVQVRQINVIS